MVSRAIIVSALCAMAALATSQDLGALARKEKDRRAKVTKPVKVWTEEDGKAATAAGSVTVITGVVPAPPAATSTPAPEEDPKIAWKAHAVAARQAIKTAQDDLTATEKEIDTVRADLAPLSATEAQDPMRIQKREERIAALGVEADRRRKVVAAARKALSDLEDEARRSGIPAGWLR